MITEIVASNIDKAGSAADVAAGLYEFTRFRNRLSKGTIGVYHHSLEMFEDFLHNVRIPAENLEFDPAQWSVCTYGVVVAFQKALQDHGYSAASINSRVAAVKVYAKCAHRAGYISAETYSRIRMIEGIIAKRDDQGKVIHSGIPGAKKTDPNFLSDSQMELLKAQPLDSPLGRRNAVLMAILADHGFRIGEALGLQVENINLYEGTITFYRQKVKKVAKHRLTKDTLRALSLYLKYDRKVESGPLLVTSIRGKLTKRKLSQAQAFGVIRELGLSVGVENLSAHDLRHSFARRAIDHGTTLDALRDAGGWSSYSMPMRYIGSAKIANEGVNLG